MLLNNSCINHLLAFLKDLVQKEKESGLFQKLPSFFFFEVTTVLLETYVRKPLCFCLCSSGESDVIGKDDALGIRTTIEELKVTRANKLRQGFKAIAAAEYILSVQVWPNQISIFMIYV